MQPNGIVQRVDIFYHYPTNSLKPKKMLKNWKKVIFESLRGIIQEKKITISRLRNRVEFPASFQLVGVQRLCPCHKTANKCECTERQKEYYHNMIADKCSGLFDMACYIGEYTIGTELKGATSEDIRKRVEKARRIQKERYADTDIKTNSALRGELLNRYCKLPEEAQKALDRLLEAKKTISAGTVNRLKRIARTIADLEGSQDIEAVHIIEAAGYINVF